MAFADVEYEMEMEPDIEPEAESIEGRATEPVTDSGIPARPVDPMPVMADEDWMRGLAPLLRVLREPETLFGASSDRKPEARRPVDWQAAPGQIRECFECCEASCTDVLFHLMLAADVLREHAVRICRGEVQVTFLQHEDMTSSVFIELSIDATSMQATTLSHELDRRAIEMEMLYDGFSFCFMDGEAGDDDEELQGMVTERLLTSVNDAARMGEIA